MTPTMTLREAARRALGIGFDRRALRERLAALEAPHAEAARARAAEIEAAKAELAAWREPVLRLQRLEAAERAAAAAEARERDEIEAKLQRNPPACVIALRNYIESVYSRVNARASDVPSHRHRVLGAALCEGTVAARDELWRMTDNAAQEECRRLRAAIDAALEAPEPEPAA